MPIAPTLILGLGGTGSRIVELVAEKVRETGNSQAGRIAFVAFDTDVNDLGRIRQNNPAIHTVQTSSRNTVGEYLNINTNARDNWFPVNEMLNRKTLTEGAAQVRAISRLAFDTTLKGGQLEPLHRAIEELFRIDKDQEEQSLRVIITSSLAGGTGSGLILSASMYLANYLRSKYPKAKAITRGFFIQPDVFYSVIKATEEQQNLQVNAYAAIRELDAFLMKGDNTLSERYKHLAFEFPRIGSDGVEAVSAMPYDFCFLFDANNASGGSLDSFATYLDHAATCIYTQSIGPMSKKSNSREDNVLREVIKNDGRNRYAGAGASRLVYPWAHVRDYVANQWTNLALSTQWMQFDDQFRDRLEGLAKQRENGFAARDLDRGLEFIGAVDTAAANKEPFARAIQSQCLAYDEDGISVIGQRWNEYVQALKQHVQKHSVVPSDEVLKRNAENAVSELADKVDADEYVNTYYDLAKYHDLVDRHTEETAGLLGYSMFQSDYASVTKDRHPHQLETYLRDKVTTSFIHPVSARYFLYQTLQTLKAEKQRVEVQLAATTRFFDTFEATAFDNPDTEEVEGAADFNSRKKTLVERMRGKPGAELQELKDKLQNYIKRVGDLREQKNYASVLEDAITYVTGLASSFETFFTSLSGNLAKLRTTIESLRTKYDDLSGSTTRYVLATSAALDSQYRAMPYTGGVVSIDSDLSEAVYSKVREYHMLTDEKDENYFQDLYRHTIIGYFAKQVMERHQAQIKIDVIEALEREYRVRERNFEEANVRHYVTAEIDKAKRLAEPFLEQPLGEERHPIQACAYNPALEGDSDPKRKSLVMEHLGNYGGEKDADISPQEILFYNAIYSIRARDLSKYSPARVLVTERRPAGTYFSAYYQLVSQIKPSVVETKVITPHIDRRWHTLAQLPDLDEGNQERQLSAIHTALLTGLAYRKIILSEVSEGRFVYQYVPDGKTEQDFVVSNGTPCDQFYEVVNALEIDPVAVSEIHATVEQYRSTRLERTRNATFAASPFARVLEEGIALRELDQPDTSGDRLGTRVNTVFDVAALYALSVPKEDFSDDDLRQLSLHFLEFVHNEVASLEDPADADEVFEHVLRQQFDTFKRNTDAYLAEQPGFARKIRTILRPLSEVLNDLRAVTFADEVDGFIDLQRVR